jgi:hypothetical protein
MPGRSDTSQFEPAAFHRMTALHVSWSVISMSVPSRGALLMSR